ncbi:2-amino-4-hydroxy-6-hydroxymethyldihydropteridine diphosphokinase [Pseudoclavibacter alba]|uniref:2-amino-4-hydroxy-6- hydroxymethyldihydropteridine diphosphokinase n=1 Tax=Pseudoclavibacter albus TaxID=272241 RepID=UPI0019D14D20|nr:2-amino-4-hydroxy-6-hydroxymethyldihydropteridine diphosphokinase [Pseudoclavibacter alba]MBN6777115.1 2-amino-4-hydroxy-6-hydroxymethyldihydropteridine diphosphokinase [Pseudoclavibacter alba]
MTRTAIIALGSNLGERMRHLRDAVAAVDSIPGVRVLAASRIYETPALTLEGVKEDAPRYLNAAIQVALNETVTSRELLNELRAIEDEAGRQRTIRWGDRTLDLDIIAVAGETRHDRELVIPHPRAHERAFVLAPWLDLEPEAVLADHGPIAELREQAGDRVDAVAEPSSIWPAEPAIADSAAGTHERGALRA